MQIAEELPNQDLLGLRKIRSVAKSEQMPQGGKSKRPMTAKEEQ